jgi:HEAT repeat protein
VTAREEARALLARDELEERCRGVARLAECAEAEVTVELASLLSESSWYLRDRVVDVLAGREGARGALEGVLRSGPWYARASACDALGRVGGPEVLPALLGALEDRNVSLQKSAAAAVRRVAGAAGEEAVAAVLSELPAERRRRALTRLAHQEPHWAGRLEEALAAAPPPAAEPAAGPVRPAFASGRAEERALVRFRRWVAGLPSGVGR